MLHAFVSRLILLSFVFSVSLTNQQNVPSCLDLRDRCQNSQTCQTALKSLSQCGNGLSGCLRNNSEACSASLDRLRITFGLNSTCSCNVQKDKFDECIAFRTTIWQNPCETAFVEEVQQIETVRVARNSEQIQRWKKEFSQEIRPNPSTLSTTSCTNALFDLCLKHISCRELWKLFRQECEIDSTNTCHMNNPNDCWQSFEGISWTGLGNCTCQTNNSDCHWIRLQTNYNKCIYEITKSGQLPNAVSVKVPPPIPSTTPIIPYWATASQTNTQQPASQQLATQHYTYQYQDRNSNGTTPVQSSYSTIHLQHEEYQRELARRENERQLHEQRMREYEERRRQWEAQRQMSQQTSQQSGYSSQQTTISSSQQTTQQTTTPTQKPYLRAIQSSTTPQSSPEPTSSEPTPTTKTKQSTYHVNGTAHYRRNVTQPTSNTSISTTPRPKPTRRPKTTTTSTTTTTSPPTTEQPKKESKNSEARLPMQFIKHRKTSTTEAPTTKDPETTQAVETTKAAVETTKPAEIEEERSNVDEDKLRILMLEEGRTRREGTLEELEGHEVLVNRWEAPVNKNEEAESTCGKALETCETDETCRWHISELQMKCRASEDCQRTQCAAAMRRFSRYVNKSLLESMMFCQCAFSDVECKHQQGWMFPRCLYDIGSMKPKWSCTQTVKLCQHDSYCLRSLNALNDSCPLSPGVAGGCVAKDLGQCRLALIGARGTELESPCYCNKDDEKCGEFQNMILPNNPCVEDSMIDFVAGGSIATASDRQLPKIKSSHSHNSTRRNQKKLKGITTTSTTTTTVEPSPKENEIVEEEQLVDEETGQDSGEEELEENELEESNNIISNNITSSNITKSSEKKSTATVPTEIRTGTASKGIKLSTKSGTSTAKIISGQAMVTQTPPPKEGGCSARNIEGDWITHHKNTVFRQYNDLSGRCSSYCECLEDEKTNCSPLGCLGEATCTTPQTKVVFGERLFIEGRGACLCHVDGKFICDSNEETIELDPGIYISLGFSREELKLLKEKVPKPLLEKCGLVSPDISVQNDISSRLQFALERVLPKDMLCRLALIERYSRENVMLLQVQWFGLDKYSNTSKDPHWHVGKIEKVCAPYIRKLEQQFMLERAARYQLILSTVKQLRVYDLLDGLVMPVNSSIFCPISSSLLLLSLLLLLVAKIELNSATTSSPTRVP